MTQPVQRALSAFLMLAGFVVLLWAAQDIYRAVSHWLMIRSSMGLGGGDAGSKTIAEIAFNDPVGILGCILGLVKLRLAFALFTLRTAAAGSPESPAETDLAEIDPARHDAYKMGAHAAFWGAVLFSALALQNAWLALSFGQFGMQPMGRGHLAGLQPMLYYNLGSAVIEVVVVAVYVGVVVALLKLWRNLSDAASAS